MKNANLKLGNPLLYKVPAPIDRLDPSAPIAITGGTFSVYVFDRDVKTEVAADASSGVLALVVSSIDGFADGDTIELSLDDATRQVVTIDPSGIDADTKTITFTPVTTDTLKTGRRVIKKLGATISGSEYGTASTTSVDWGYIAEIPRDQDPTIDEVQALQVEGIIDESGSGAHWEEAWNVIVSEAWGDS